MPSPKKMQLLCECVTFLGYVVGPDGVMVAPATVTAVATTTGPTVSRAGHVRMAARPSVLVRGGAIDGLDQGEAPWTYEEHSCR